MEVIDQASSDWGEDNERVVLLVTYVLHSLCFIGVTALIAVIINYIKIKETHSEAIRSHHRWLLRTFWWGLLWGVVSFVMMFVAVGFAGFLILGIWWLYRVIYGAINFLERKPMPV